MIEGKDGHCFSFRRSFSSPKVLFIFAPTAKNKHYN